MLGVAQKGTRPHMASWLAWTVSWVVLFAVAAMNHSYLVMVFTGAGAIRSGLVVIVSQIYHRARWRFDGIDMLCIASAGICMWALILMPQRVLVGATLAGLANLIAAFPTIRQAWKRPHDDDWQIYATNVLACVATCAGVILDEKMVISSFVGPVASLVNNGIVVLLLAIRRLVIQPVESFHAIDAKEA